MDIFQENEVVQYTKNGYGENSRKAARVVGKRLDESGKLKGYFVDIGYGDRYQHLVEADPDELKKIDRMTKRRSNELL